MKEGLLILAGLLLSMQALFASGPAGEQTPIPQLPVRYSPAGEGELAIAYFDAASGTLYRWKGVTVAPGELASVVPHYEESTLDQQTASKLKIVEIDPPVRWALLPGRDAVPGFLDLPGKTFYAWRNIDLDKHRVPHTSPHNRSPILDPQNLGLRVIEIEAPRHMLEHPERWAEQ